MKVIKSTGLVPVKALVRFERHRSGSVFGMTVEQVRKALPAGEVELHPISEDVETFDVPDVSIPSKKAPVDESSETVVEIPDDWEGLQWLQRVKLAKAIGGEVTPVGDETGADAANRIIREEIQRR